MTPGSYELIFKDINDHDNAVIIDRWPDMCPVCESGIDAKLIGAHGKNEWSSFDSGCYVQALFKCPKRDCQAVFVGYYTAPRGRRYTGDNYVFLNNTFIRSFFKVEEFDEEIKTLSTNFIKIFTQAKVADDMGLELICGSGYRKALEFLVKDYLIYIKPQKKVVINDLSLGTLIVKEVDYEKIKIAAGLAKDVGNDETHYQKKLEGLTIEDLKKLIKITAHWISDELTMNGYLEKITFQKKASND